MLLVILVSEFWEQNINCQGHTVLGAERVKEHYSLGPNTYRVKREHYLI